VSRWATGRLVRAVRAGDWARATTAVGERADPDVGLTARVAGQAGKVTAPVLFWALAAGAGGLVQALLLAGASVTHRLAVTPDRGQALGQTALDWVTREADLLALLRAGLGQFTACGNDARDSVLHIAASHGWLEAARFVVERTGMVEVRNGFGQTPLHAVVRAPRLPRERLYLRRMIDYLVEAGAPLEARDEVGDTPLATAMTHAPQLVRALLKAGADLTALAEPARQAALALS